MDEVPDGYERWGEQGLRLIDPEWCPQGHPFEGGSRGFVPCVEHDGHPSWRCPCGQKIYRHAGEFVGELDCQHREYMPPL